MDERPTEEGWNDRLGSYEDWKHGNGADVRVSSFIGVALGGLTVSLIYAVPIYLVIAAFASSVTIVPDTTSEWFVLGAITLVGAIPFISRMARADASQR